jgi:hypothetical protein
MSTALQSAAQHRARLAHEIALAKRTGRPLLGMMREYAEMTALEHRLVIARLARPR